VVHWSGSLKADLEVPVERFVGVEDARGSLGRLVEEVATGGDVVALTKRGKALAVLVSREEYLRMKLESTHRARAELSESLGSARRAVREAGLDVAVIDEAIAAARRL
jgi:prevent-host-death family protein